MWEETLVFMVHMPEITLVRFLVWDHDPIGRDFIGQRTIAFNSMMPGKSAVSGGEMPGALAASVYEMPLFRQFYNISWVCACI